jgi:hypothetical protein
LKASSPAFLTVSLAIGLASVADSSVASVRAEAEAVSRGSIATRPQVEVSEGPLPGYSQVVDNATEGRLEAPGWEVRSDGEHYAHARLSEKAPARFKVDVPESG